MTLNFADLTQKMRAGARPTQKEILDVLGAGPGATFALVEFAAEFRRMFFKNTLEVARLLTQDGEMPAVSGGVGEVIAVGSSESLEELAEQIFSAGQSHTAGRVTVDFLVSDDDSSASPAADLNPMYCLRVLVAVRLASTAKSVRVRQGRALHLRSLQALSLHVVDALDLRDDYAAEIFEDLRMIQDAGLVINGAENRDLVADYVAYFQEQGISGAKELADAVFTVTDPAESSSGGCDGACGCGSSGCS